MIKSIFEFLKFLAFGKRLEQQLDERLMTTGVVDEHLFGRFRDSYEYDSASTVGWVAAKLGVLATRLEAGSPLKLFEPAHGTKIDVHSRDEFNSWIDGHFPAARPPELK